MKYLLLLLSFGINAHAADAAPMKPMKCGARVIKFEDGGDRVILGGETFSVDWSDDGADGLFGEHHLQVDRRNAFKLDGEPCVTIETSW